MGGERGEGRGEKCCVDASLVTLRCLLSVTLSARGRFSPIIISCDGRYSLPHPLIRFIQTSPTYLLSDSCRLQRSPPSVPLNGQSIPTPCHSRHQTNPRHQQPLTLYDSSNPLQAHQLSSKTIAHWPPTAATAATCS